MHGNPIKGWADAATAMALVGASTKKDNVLNLPDLTIFLINQMGEDMIRVRSVVFSI